MTVLFYTLLTENLYRHHLLCVHGAMEVLGKLLPVYKIQSYVDLYSPLR